MHAKAVVICLVVILSSACASQRVSSLRSIANEEAISINVSEGTMLGFDLAGDGKSIIVDLLGQLWLLPANGGIARAVSDAVRDTAEDLDPTFSPDGRSVVFRAERNGRTGLWLLDLDHNTTRQLTQLVNPDGYDGSAAWSPDGKIIAFEHTMPPDSASGSPRNAIALLDVATGTIRVLRIDDLPGPNAQQPAWSADAQRIAVVSEDRGGRRIWIVDAGGGRAAPVTGETLRAYAPAFSPDGRKLAFIGRDSANRVQVWVQEIAGSATQLTNHADVAPTRVRWSADGSSLLYSADGRLWRAPAGGGASVEIPFTAQLTLVRAQRSLPPARFPEPGKTEPARAFTGLALSPDARSIAALALGKLWLIPVGGAARAIIDISHTARHLAWSRDGISVAWSAGPWGEEDLFETTVLTGATRQVTKLPGREMLPVYSPDGRSLAFVHGGEEGVLRVIDVQAATVTDTVQTRNLGSASVSWTASNVEVPQWSPASDALVVSGDWNARPVTGTLIRLTGERQTIAQFPDAPLFMNWLKDNSVVFVRHDRLWRAPFDRTGMRGAAEPLGDAAALYASVSDNGAILYISEDGLRLRAPSGSEQRLGWPVSFTPPTAAPLLIRNVRIVDGSGAVATSPADILVAGGRIKRIANAGTLIAQGATEVDAAGRFAMPGLIDLHAHSYLPHLLRGFLYFGVTTVRDQGSAIAPLVAYADMFAAGVLPGPRISYGGFQFYSDWSLDEDQGRGLEPEADAGHVSRSVGLAQAFGAQHIKTRTFRRWDINARMIAEAQRRGMRATGHCAHPLALVAAGIAAKEHIGLCAVRGNGQLWPLADMTMYDDELQLFRAAGIAVVPTISYFSLAARLSAQPTLLDSDTELAPFLMPASMRWMTQLSPRLRAEWARAAREARETSGKLARAGVTIGTGTDIWQVPTAVHMELEELVGAGLSPAQAIRAATASAARIIGAEGELGTIEVGKWADLIILDADPLTDIRNTRRIWRIVQTGRIVDRPALLQSVSATDKAFSRREE